MITSIFFFYRYFSLEEILIRKKRTINFKYLFLQTRHTSRKAWYPCEAHKRRSLKNLTSLQMVAEKERNGEKFEIFACCIRVRFLRVLKSINIGEISWGGRKIGGLEWVERLVGVVER